MLFGAGFYKASSRFYAEAVRKGGPTLWRALYADALMFAGSFAEARDAFGLYLQEEPNPGAEWVLKHWASRFICELDRTATGRHSRLAMEALRPLLEHTSQSSGAATDAIGWDPLCISAWLYFADSFDESIAESKREIALIMAALLARNDPHLWIQALFYHSSDPELEDIRNWSLLTALHAVGSELLDAFQQHAEYLKMPNDAIYQITELLRTALSEYEAKKEPDTFEVRLAGHQGGYESVTLVLGEPQTPSS